VVPRIFRLVKHVYLHIPFCRRRCSYCDFQIAVRRDVPSAAFVRDVVAEIAVRGLVLTPVDTLYLGGGTPSLLAPGALTDLVALVPRAEGAEVTIEANPEDVTEAAARAWVAAGVNRVSLGVQSFSAAVLQWMRRPHGPAAPAGAMSILRAAGIANVSVDVIYGVPDTLGRDLAHDLDQLLALAPTHISAYGLTVEPRTPLGRWVAAGQVVPAADERHADEFLAVHAVLVAAGFAHYEVSNYGRPGHASRHNQACWTGADYLGLGPAAHGLADGERRWNLGPWPAWSAALARGDDPVAGRETLTAAQRALERVYLGLRTTSGLAAHDPALEPRHVAAARDQGWLTIADGRVSATPDGWLRLDALVARLTTSAFGG
jgi:oxygen-independent coproporphyrinogen-3 oxidase